MFDCTVPNNTLSRVELSYDEGTVLNVHYGDVLIKYGSVLDVQKDDIPRIPHRCREDFNGALLQDGDVIIADTAEDETTGKACEIGNLQGSAIVSGLHTMVCRPRNRMALGYLGYYLNSNAYHHQLLPLMQGIKVLSLSRSNIQKTSVSYPSAMKEQQLIASYFSQLDHLITLHQRKCEFLFSFFRACISMNFTASTFSWEQRKVGDLLIERNQQAPMSDEYPLMAFIANEGVAPKGERYDRSALVTDTVNKLYKKTEKGDFIYSSNNLETGSIGLNKYGKACISPVYSIFEPTGIADSDFLGRRLVRKDFINAMVKWRQGVIYGQWRIHESDFLKIEITVPSVEEQRKIGTYLDQLDHLITLHQRKCANLCSPSQVVFSLLFVTSTFSWEQRKVSDLAEKTYGGGTPTTSNEAYWNGDIPWIQSSDVVDGKLLGVEPRKWITQDGLNNSAAQLIPGNSIAIITRVGVGKLAFMPYSYATSQDFLSLSKLNAEPLFTVYACYKKLQSELNAVQGTSIKGITKDELLAKNIMVPRYAEQQQIGAFFKQLDNLITLHQRECISFTGRADRLILTANKKRTTSSWEQRKLGDVVQITMGQSPDGSTYSDEPSDYILVQGNADLQNGWVCPRIWTTQITKKADAGDLIMSVRAPAGAMGKTAYNAVIGRGVAAIKGNEFIYQLLVKMDADGFWKTLSCGSTFESLNSDNIKNAEVKIPTTAEQIKIGGYFQQLDNLITLHQRKPFLMKWRTSDANRNQTNRLVL